MLVRETLAMGSYLVFFYIETFLKISDNIISLSIYKRPQVNCYGQFPAHSTHIHTQTYNYGFKIIIEAYNKATI